MQKAAIKPVNKETSVEVRSTSLALNGGLSIKKATEFPSPKDASAITMLAMFIAGVIIPFPAGPSTRASIRFVMKFSKDTAERVKKVPTAFDAKPPLFFITNASLLEEYRNIFLISQPSILCRENLPRIFGLLLRFLAIL